MTAPCWRAHTFILAGPTRMFTPPCTHTRVHTYAHTLTRTRSRTHRCSFTLTRSHVFTLTVAHVHMFTPTFLHSHTLPLARIHVHPRPNTVTEFYLLTPLTCSLTDSPRVPPPESRAHLFAPWACSQVSCSSLLTIPCRLVPGKEELGQCRVPRGAAVTGKDCEEMLSFRRVTRKRREGWRCHLLPRGAGRTCVELGS